MVTTQFGEDRCTQFRVIVLTDTHANAHTNPQTGPITIHSAAKLSAQYNPYNCGKLERRPVSMYFRFIPGMWIKITVLPRVSSRTGPRTKSARVFVVNRDLSRRFRTAASTHSSQHVHTTFHPSHSRLRCHPDILSAACCISTWPTAVSTLPSCVSRNNRRPHAAP